MERLYSYKMSHDNRFAPNPLFGVLTLATCKPQLRKNAKVGDWIAGWTLSHIAHTPTPVGEERLIYLARVSEKLTFAEYWEKYPAKRPVYTDDTSVLERYGDNIYTVCARLQGVLLFQLPKPSDNPCGTPSASP